MQVTRRRNNGLAWLDGRLGWVGITWMGTGEV